MQHAGECRLNMFRRLPLQGLTSGQLGVLIGYFTEWDTMEAKASHSYTCKVGLVLPLPRSTDETT